MCTHRLSAHEVHFAWDNALPPLLSIKSGETVTLETRDSANGYYAKDSTAEDVLRKGPLKGHPLTGPIAVEGARPGDVLAVRILDVSPRADFGWTAIRPGRGLLPQAEFPDPYLQIWDISDGRYARMPQRSDIAVPIACFPGIVGTALAPPGRFTTMPPRENGGNIDFRHLVPGSTILLPVFRDGGLLSIGDAHAAQGDGEACITAIEIAAAVTVRVDLVQGRSIAEPQFRLEGPPGRSTAASPTVFVTLSSGPDLHACAQNAIRYMVDHLVAERGLSREEAYVLASVCVDLKITQIVDAPNWSVAAFLPEMVFV